MSAREEEDLADSSCERDASPPSDTIAVKVPTLHALSAQSVPDLHNTTRQSIQSNNENPMETEQEVEAEDRIVTPPSPKHSTTTRSIEDASQDLGNSEVCEENAAPRTSPAEENRISKASAAQHPQSGDHIVLADANDCALFFYKTEILDVDLRTIDILEIHLDTNKLNDFAEYRLSLALRKLHPHQDKSNPDANPHNLQAVYLLMKGNLLFTRYSYHLVSPAMSNIVDVDLAQLFTGKLTQEEKIRLPYKINSTERVLSKALLGIRGVEHVFIEGKGMMEGNFAETIKATLVQPPGAGIVQSEDPELPYSTYRLNGVGTIASEAYGGRAHRPYPTAPASFEYEFSTLPDKDMSGVDEKVELLGHFTDLTEDQAKAAAMTQNSAPSSRRAKRTFDVGTVETIRASNRRTAAATRWRQDEQEQEDGDGDESESLQLKDMVCIKARKQYPEDQGFESAYDCSPMVLTGREGTVELGWKVR